MTLCFSDQVKIARSEKTRGKGKGLGALDRSHRSSSRPEEKADSSRRHRGSSTAFGAKIQEPLITEMTPIVGRQPRTITPGSNSLRQRGWDVHGGGDSAQCGEKRQNTVPLNSTGKRALPLCRELPCDPVAGYQAGLIGVTPCLKKKGGFPRGCRVKGEAEAPEGKHALYKRENQGAPSWESLRLHGVSNMAARGYGEGDPSSHEEKKVIQSSAGRIEGCRTRGDIKS